MFGVICARRSFGIFGLNFYGRGPKNISRDVQPYSLPRLEGSVSLELETLSDHIRLVNAKVKYYDFEMARK